MLLALDRHDARLPQHRACASRTRWPRTRRCRRILGLLHGKHATPHAGIWILVAVSALFGIYGVQPAQTDNITQITLASNTGTFLVYGFTCLIAIVAFASRHDQPCRQALRHPRARRADEPGRAVRRGRTWPSRPAATPPTDAYKALGMVGVWIAHRGRLGGAQSEMRGTKVFDDDARRNERRRRVGA